MNWWTTPVGLNVLGLLLKVGAACNRSLTFLNNIHTRYLAWVERKLKGAMGEYK